MPPFLRWILTAAAAVSQRKEAPRARSPEPNGYPSVARNHCSNQTYKHQSILTGQLKLTSVPGSRRAEDIRLRVSRLGQRQPLDALPEHSAT
jgi:hypothetical protein